VPIIHNYFKDERRKNVEMGMKKGHEKGHET
jgi:hypothetical protein